MVKTGGLESKARDDGQKYVYNCSNDKEVGKEILFVIAPGASAQTDNLLHHHERTGRGSTSAVKLQTARQQRQGVVTLSGC